MTKIVATGHPRPTGQELIRFTRERVGYKAPEEIVFIDEIPLNPTGKVDRTGLTRLAQEHLTGECPIRCVGMTETEECHVCEGQDRDRPDR
jgi:hypothetical protein